MSTYYQAISLDGGTERIDVPDDPTLDITDEFSIAAWVECGSQGTVDTIAMKWSGTTQRSWFLRTASYGFRKLELAFTDNGTTTSGHWKNWATAGDVLPNSGWAHVVVTFAAGSIRMWVNGNENTGWSKAHDDPITTIYASTSDVQIGGQAGQTRTWNGDICNYSIWDTEVLSPSDAAALCNGGDNLDPNDLAPTGAASLVSSWIWNEELPLVPGANDIPDNTASNDGTTQGTITSGDVVDSPWELQAAPSCLYVPDGYVTIPDAAFYPGQYIREGEDDPTDGSDSTTKGLVDLACNSNYIHKRVVKSHVRQDLQSYSDPTKVIVTTGGSPIHVASWRIERLPVDQGLRVRYVAKTADANAVQVLWKLYDFDTHLTSVTEEDTFSAVGYSERTVEFDSSGLATYLASVGYDGPHVLELWVAEEDVGGVAHLKTVLAESTDDGESEVESGERDSAYCPQCWESWPADSAYSVDQVNILSDNVAALRADKASTLIAFCDDLQDLTHPAFESQSSSSDWQVVVKVPIEYQPGVAAVGFAIAGFRVDSSDRFRIYTREEVDQEGLGNVSERQFSGLQGSFDITDAADWVTGSLPVKPTSAAKGEDLVVVEFRGSVTRGVTMVALEIWED